MKILLAVVGVLGFIATGYADSRYPIHPTDGEFAATSNPCGQQTRDELYNRVIKFVPTLIVGPVQTPGGRGAWVLNIAGDDLPSDETVNGEGRWYYNGKQQLKTQKIVLRPARKDKPRERSISISVIRRMDELECSERWVGLVQEQGESSGR